jgi:hypothetical protein
MNDIKLPYLESDLVQALDKLFPEKCPDPRMSERDIWIYVGKRQLVQFIKEQHERQQENILGGN